MPSNVFRSGNKARLGNGTSGSSRPAACPEDAPGNPGLLALSLLSRAGEQGAPSPTINRRSLWRRQQNKVHLAASRRTAKRAASTRRSESVHAFKVFLRARRKILSEGSGCPRLQDE